MFEVLIIETAVIVIYMTAWFIVAQVLKRNDIADVIWGTCFIVAVITATASSDAVSPRGLLASFLVTIWGIRLSAHIYMRNRGKPEDPRYRKWRKDWGRHAVIRAYMQIFLLQGLLVIIISLPVTFVIVHPQDANSIFDVAGVCVWLAGFFFETVGDYQLMKYKKDLTNKGKIMTKGLWSYTRHPNYFGEVTIWWGLYLIALSVPGGWMTIPGPLTITFLILKVSGIPLLEEKYKDSPEFQSYKRRTSAFFPFPPRKEA